MRSLLVGLSSVCLFAAAPAFAEDSPDPVVTARTKLKLWTTAGVPSMAVKVDSTEGRVTLSGKVGTTAERELAGKAAAEVDGVRSVRNLLQVVPPGQAAKVAVADGRVRSEVARVLQKDADFRAVRVSSVNEGVVALDGEVPALTDHVTLVSRVWLVPGVKRVSSEVKVATATANEPPPTASDGAITTAVKLRLLLAAEVPSLEVSVDTAEGEVTLFGIVPTKKARSAAEREARQAPGVKKVVNELQVVAASERPFVERKDDEIRAALTTDFASRPALRAVSFEVKAGVVRLTGEVPTFWDELNALRLARFTDGVRRLDSALTVRGGLVN